MKLTPLTVSILCLSLMIVTSICSWTFSTIELKETIKNLKQENIKKEKEVYVINNHIDSLQKEINLRDKNLIYQKEIQDKLAIEMAKNSKDLQSIKNKYAKTNINYNSLDVDDNISFFTKRVPIQSFN